MSSAGDEKYKLLPPKYSTYLLQDVFVYRYIGVECRRVSRRLACHYTIPRAEMEEKTKACQECPQRGRVPSRTQKQLLIPSFSTRNTTLLRVDLPSKPVSSRKRCTPLQCLLTPTKSVTPTQKNIFEALGFGLMSTPAPPRPTHLEGLNLSPSGGVGSAVAVQAHRQVARPHEFVQKAKRVVQAGERRRPISVGVRGKADQRLGNVGVDRAGFGRVIQNRRYYKRGGRKHTYTCTADLLPSVKELTRDGGKDEQLRKSECRLWPCGRGRLLREVYSRAQTKTAERFRAFFSSPQ